MLPLAQARVQITTVSHALDELRTRSDSARAHDAARDALESLGWSKIDRELTDPAIMALLPHLASHGISHAIDGEEIESGIMVDLAWPEQRVAVFAEEGAQDAPLLEKAGWRVVVTGEDAGATAALVAKLVNGVR